jgi:hypothetical protein
MEVIMLALKVNDIKEFMFQMLKKNTFDSFQVRDVIITTFTTFEMKCDINKDFYENPETAKEYCLWKDLKPFVFEIVKGKKLPKLMKIVFAADDALKEEINKDASVLYINVVFENNELFLTSGLGMKTFTLDKSAEFLWDEYITSFLKKNGVSVSTRIE